MNLRRGLNSFHSNLTIFLLLTSMSLTKLDDDMGFITLNPALSVRFLKDPIADKEAASMRPGTYLSTLGSNVDINFVHPDYEEIELVNLFGTKPPRLDVERHDCESSSKRTPSSHY